MNVKHIKYADRLNSSRCFSQQLITKIRTVLEQALNIYFNWRCTSCLTSLFLGCHALTDTFAHRLGLICHWNSESKQARKSQYTMGDYLNMVTHPKVRNNLSKYRLSEHWVPKENYCHGKIKQCNFWLNAKIYISRFDQNIKNELNYSSI